MMPKIIANYLPQYHVIPENSRWWGEGYTDWEGVKKATPLFPGHIQPRVPENGVYYTLDDPEAIKRQVKLAKKYGIDGFGIYHYWFSSSLNLLQTPAELILRREDIDMGYLFLWDNCSWKRTWSSLRGGNDWAPAFDNADDQIEGGVLAELDYGGVDDWVAHFDYLLPFFKDHRYIKRDGRPVFGFMKPSNQFGVIREMASCWDELARKNGLPGICCVSCDTWMDRIRGTRFESTFRYSPFQPQSLSEWLYHKRKNFLSRKRNEPCIYNYDEEWERILNAAKRCDSDTILSGFVAFDDTPRRGRMARIALGATPKGFERYFSELLKIAKLQGKDFVFLSAWNEWGEGMYLEPDERYGTAWLEAVGSALRAAGVRGE